ncbi:hypothetical protein SDC9_202138 [bioreactor metagenome]|uniref:Uncharacterized protein n=1 Tax=bioreactor metagenome TaxID=1076179 RepID=A0A645ISW9_9ZZZZ
MQCRVVGGSHRDRDFHGRAGRAVVNGHHRGVVAGHHVGVCPADLASVHGRFRRCRLIAPVDGGCLDTIPTRGGGQFAAGGGGGLRACAGDLYRHR